ncbi:MAG: hypothetical protein GY856_25855, partial [bacterium]|nr:hypothetical protein [bacterium]
YTAAAATLSFAPGTTEQSVAVEIAGDLEEERTEHFAVELSAAVGGEILDGHAEATLYDNDGWYLNGDPRPIPDQCIELTAGDRRQEASAWKKQLLDLGESFDKTFRVFLGDYDEGGDGMVFALQTKGSSALGTLGMGYYGISPSVGVELDTDESAGDHLAIDLNGSLSHVSAAVEAAGENIEDGREHELRLIWNVAAKVLDVHFDHEELLIYEKDLLGSVFGFEPLVYYGFTSQTISGSLQRHYFCPTLTCYGDGEAPRISIGDATVEEGDAGTVGASFPVTLSCPTDQEVRVEYATTDDTAIAGSDYQAAAGTVTFQPGETSRHVTVEVKGDPDGEATERFFIRLSDPVGAEVRYHEGVGTILSDDALFLLEGKRYAEGEPHHGGEFLEVSLLGPITREAKVRIKTVTGTTSENDHSSLNHTETFKPGETNKLLEIRIKGDVLVEDDENFFITFSDMVHGTAINDPVEFWMEDDDDAVCPTGVNLVVNGSGEIPMIGEEIPGWTPVGGSGWRIVSGGADWLGGHLEANCGGGNELYQDVDLSTYARQIDRGDLTLRFEGLMMEFTIAERGDLVVEALAAGRQNVLDRFDGREYVPAAYKHNRLYARVARIFLPPAGTRWIRLRLLTGCTTAFDAITLQTLRAPALMVDDVAVVEGDAGTTRADFQVRLLCASDHQVSVDYLTADDTAQTPGDYQPTQGRLVFEPGELSRLVGVEVRGDTLTEGDETFFLHLANSLEAGIGDGEGVATIVDDEVFLSIADATVVEGDGGTTAAVFTVSLSAASELEVRVDYATESGSATAGSDFLESSGTLVFAPGERSRELTVAVLGDELPEPDESFEVHLSDPIRASLATSVATGWIRDDELTFSIGDGAVVEGDVGTAAMTFEVSLSGPSAETTSVAYATHDGTAVAGEDYQTTSGTLSFAPGEILEYLEVTVLGDTVAEATEFFVVELSDPVAANVGDGEATGLITDDDDCAGPNLLLNPGFEQDLVAGEIPQWTEHAGTAWGTLITNPFAGRYYAHPGGSGPEPAELRQEVEVSAYAPSIDRGIQRFLFEGTVRSKTPGGTDEVDPTRLVVEYRDAGGENLLGVFDSGEMINTDGWRQVVDLRPAPVGTRSIRVRLISRSANGSGHIYGYFDALALRSLGIPMLSVDDLELAEGDDDPVDAVFTMQLTCGGEKSVSVDYATADGRATAGVDYQPIAGTLSFAAGETELPLVVVTEGDYENEVLEEFYLELSNPVDLVVLDPVAEVRLRDADPARPPVPPGGGPGPGPGMGSGWFYTLDEDFELGHRMSVEYTTPPGDQLQIDVERHIFSNIWIAASDRGTIVKIDVDSGEILGEYSTNPDNEGGSDPSRTTVTLDGSVWVANRNGESVAHIGLPELSQCVDRNGNGMIDTSTGYGEILPWPNPGHVDTWGGVSTAEDECILHYVRVNSSGTRHISVTRDNSIWV